MRPSDRCEKCPNEDTVSRTWQPYVYADFPQYQQTFTRALDLVPKLETGKAVPAYQRILDWWRRQDGGRRDGMSQEMR